MKYPCNIIKDLLPLYIDNVCSAESKEIVEQHLVECPECKSYYLSMTENNDTLSAPINQDMEWKKAQSFIAVKRKIRLKQLVVAIMSAVVLIAVFLSTVAILSNYEKAVLYEDNISVSMVDGSLVERLNGSAHEMVSIKRIEGENNGDDFVYLFFCIYDTKWNELVTGKNVFTECVLCPKDRGADQVDAVYYFVGDTTGMETMRYDELQKIIDQSVLLWSK